MFEPYDKRCLNRCSSLTFWTKAATFVAIGGLSAYALEAGLLTVPYLLIATLAASFAAAILFTVLECYIDKKQNKLQGRPAYYCWQ